MSHEPPIPEAARSPYPLQPPPAGLESPQAVAEESGPGRADPVQEPASVYDQLKSGGDALVERARDTFERVKESRYGIGAAIGIGSAALLAAVLYARRGSKAERSTARASSRPRRAARAAPEATGAAKPAVRKRASAAPKPARAKPGPKA